MKKKRKEREKRRAGEIQNNIAENISMSRLRRQDLSPPPYPKSPSERRANALIDNFVTSNEA